jgi:hypothetical protein
MRVPPVPRIWGPGKHYMLPVDFLTRRLGPSFPWSLAPLSLIPRPCYSSNDPKISRWQAANGENCGPVRELRLE